MRRPRVLIPIGVAVCIAALVGWVLDPPRHFHFQDPAVRLARYNRRAVEIAPNSDVTVLLQAWQAGDHDALNRLMSILYDELRRTARIYMRREREGHTLQTTALVNEALMRLIGARNIEYTDRVHFFALAARMMRRVLVDHARARGVLKRGSGERPVTLDEFMIASPNRDAEIVALDEALEELAKRDQRKAQIVEMRFFAGLSMEETATALGVSSRTVLRDWNLSKAWLMRRINGAEPV